MWDRRISFESREGCVRSMEHLFARLFAFKALDTACGFHSSSSTHSTEALAQLGNEQLGLLERGEVTTSRNLVPVEEL
jgi:hypothetical protein